jgi:hypothetical protein
MYPSAYFTPRAFAPRYFPEVGADTVGGQIVAAGSRTLRSQGGRSLTAPERVDLRSPRTPGLEAQ